MFCLIHQHWTKVFIILFAAIFCCTCASASGFALVPGEFQNFRDIYEPSGIQQLQDGRFVVVEDEPERAIHLLEFVRNTKPREKSLSLVTRFTSLILDDLEAIALDDQNYVYVITSHSRKKNGEREQAREQLVRLKIDIDAAVQISVVDDLRGHILKNHIQLKRAAAIHDVKRQGGFNIEALSFDRHKKRLFIGFRNPIESQNALIVTLENPHNVFERHEDPLISSEVIRLYLDGGGIRAMTYDEHMNGFLVLSKNEQYMGSPFKLWWWDGVSTHDPIRVHTLGVRSLRNAEGITSAEIDGHKGVLIVSDEGYLKNRSSGSYLFLSYDQLEIKNKLQPVDLSQ